MTAAVLEPFLDTRAAGEFSGSVDATLSLDTPSLDISAVRGELQLDRLDLRIADLPVDAACADANRRARWFRARRRLGLDRPGRQSRRRGQVRLSDLQAAILANGEIDLRMATPFVRAAGLTTAGSLQPRLSMTGVLTDPRIDGDLLVAGAEMRLNDPRASCPT